MCSNYPGIKLEPALGTKKDKIEHLSSYAQVVHTTTKHVISRRRKNENFYKMSKNEKCTCEACKNTVFHFQIWKSVGFLLPSSSCLLKLSVVVSTTYNVTELTYFPVFFLPFANRLYQFNSKTRTLFTVEISLTPELV